MVLQTSRPLFAIQQRGKPKSLGEYVQAAGSKEGAMFLAYLSGGYTQKEIADYFGVHYSTVSRAVKQRRQDGRRRHHR